MAIAGKSLAGVSLAGQTRVLRDLPFTNYRDLGPWLEEWINALGQILDETAIRFLSEAARTAMLDVDIGDGPWVASETQATQSEAPAGALTQDTMLDVLLWMCGYPIPLDSSVTVDQKRALVRLTQAIFKQKGVRRNLLNIAAQLTDGVVYGYTNPPFGFAVIVPDCAQSPGWGSWVPPTGSTSIVRPPVYNAIRQLLTPLFPGAAELGIGPTHARAGYTGAGEIVGLTGSSLSLLRNEHFSNWPGGGNVLADWSPIVAAFGEFTPYDPSADPYINLEFTNSASFMDVDGGPPGDPVGLSQDTGWIDPERVHRVSVDYRYTNPAMVDTLRLQVSQRDPYTGQVSYWTGTSASSGHWTTNSTGSYVALPPSATRTRYAMDVHPLSGSKTGRLGATNSVNVSILAVSDGTATTNSGLGWTLYRCGLFQKWDLQHDMETGPELLFEWPLRSGRGWTNAHATGSNLTYLEIAKSDRSAVRLVPPGSASFGEHPSLGGRAFRSIGGGWTNILKGTGNILGSDWTWSGDLVPMASGTTSPVVTDAGSTSPVFVSEDGNEQLLQNMTVDPNGRTYVGGVWAKKLNPDIPAPGAITTVVGSTQVTGSAGANFGLFVKGTELITPSGRYTVDRVLTLTTLLLAQPAGRSETSTFDASDVVIDMRSTNTHSQGYSLSQAEGWKLLPFRFTFTSGSELAQPTFEITAGIKVLNSMSFAYPYVYDATANPSVLYPPVAVTSVGHSGSVPQANCQVVTWDTVRGTGVSTVAHPTLRRSMISLKQGALDLTVVPTFDATDQPQAELFFAGGITSGANIQLLVEISGGQRRLSLYQFDDATHVRRCHIPLSNSSVDLPSAASWQRDQDRLISLSWSPTVLSLSIGGRTAIDTSLPFVSSDVPTGVGISIGNFVDGTFPFDGHISDVRSYAIGTLST